MQTETGMFLLSALQSRPDPSLRDAIRREVQQELHALGAPRPRGLAEAARARRRATSWSARSRRRWSATTRCARRRRGRPAPHRHRRRSSAAPPRRCASPASAPETASAERCSRGTPPRPRRPCGRPRSRCRRSRRPGPPVRAAPDRPRRPPLPRAEPSSSPPDTAAAAGEAQAAAPTAPRAHPASAGAARRLAWRGRSPGSSGFEGQAQIEHLLMEGEVRMTVADYANAVKVYEKLVDGRAARGRLPRAARGRHGLLPAHRQARRARVLRGGAARARQRRDPLPVGPLLQGDEDHAAARSRRCARRCGSTRATRRPAPELEALSPKDSALTSLKKLFR